jgi:very-short-patch-repair endonuclease
LRGFTDFYCHSIGVVVEVDGKIHGQQQEYDARRDQIISARGLRVIRIRNEEIVNDIDHVLGLIQDVCESESKLGRRLLSRPLPDEAER